MAEPPLIFISHARTNARVTDTIATMIAGRGLVPWVDRQRLAGGQQWAAELERAIHDCAAFVLVLTPAALRSDYVRREYLLALALRKPIILVRLQSGGPMPPELQAFPVIDFTKGRSRGFVALTVSLLDHGIVGKTAGSFDVDGTVALAQIGRVLPSWSIFRVSRRSYILASLWYLLVTVATGFSGWSIQSNLLTRALPLSTVIPTLVFIVLYMIALTTFSLLTIFVLVLFGRIMPEIIVVTSDGIARRAFSLFQSERLTTNQRIDFNTLVELTSLRNILGLLALRGQVRPSLVAQQYIGFRIPHRFGASRAIVQSSIAAYERFGALIAKQANTVTPTRMGSATPTVKRDPIVAPLAPAEFAKFRTIAIITAPADRTKAQRLADELHQRGYAIRVLLLAANMTIPPDDVILLALSPVTLRHLAVEQFLHRAAPVIPVLLRRVPKMPPAIASLQWVDLAQGDPQRNLYNLLYTLDIAGAVAATPSATLWADLVLTRDMHGQIPPVWHSYHVREEQYPQLRRGFLWTFVRNLASLFLLVPLSLGGIIVTISEGSGITLPLISILLITFVASSFTYIFQRQARLMKWFYQERLVPEAIIVTPEGFIVRARQRWWVSTTAYAFQDIASLRLRRFASPSSYARLPTFLSVEVTMRGDGRKVSVAIPTIVLDWQQAGVAIVAAFAQYEKTARQPLAQ